MTQASDWCGRKPDDPKPIVYHGGVDIQNLPIMQKAGCRFFAISYLEVFRSPTRTGALLEQIRKIKGRVFLDSGAFTFLRLFSQGKAVTDQTDYLKSYSRWLRKPPLKPDFYVTFDCRPEAKLTWEMTRKLQRMGIQPVPVYHGDASIDWVHRYADTGHKLIGLSKRFFLHDRKTMWQFFDQVFNVTEKLKMAVHGLACTEASSLLRWPWYSVDSTSAAYASRCCRVYRRVGRYNFVQTNVGKNRRGPLPGDIQEFALKNGIEPKSLEADVMKCFEFNLHCFRELSSSEPKVWVRRSLF